MDIQTAAQSSNRFFASGNLQVDVFFAIQAYQTDRRTTEQRAHPEPAAMGARRRATPLPPRVAEDPNQ